jgi:hypothetical protein
MTKYELAIEELIREAFDDGSFTKLHDVYKFLDWKWSNGKIPSIFDLSDKARELLNCAINDQEVSTGGLRATFYENGSDFEFNLYLSMDVGFSTSDSIAKKTVKLLDNNGKPLEFIIVSDNENEMVLKLTSKFDKYKTSYKMKTDYGVDEYPFNENWGKDFINKRKNMDCGND